MVESTVPGKNLENVNIDQLVHIKAMETGYLTFDKHFIDVPGMIYGTKKKLQQFEETSSFLPFTVNDRTKYGPGQPFTDLPRPYREGFVEKPEDIG